MPELADTRVLGGGELIVSKPDARAKWRETRTTIVRSFCHQYDVELVELNDGYQLRLDGILDIYPTNGRWHIMETGERGDWHVSENQLADLLAHAKRVSDKPISITMPANDFNKSEHRIKGIRLMGMNNITVHDVTVPQHNTQTLVDIIEGNDHRKKPWYKRLWQKVRR